MVRPCVVDGAALETSTSLPLTTPKAMKKVHFKTRPTQDKITIRHDHHKTGHDNKTGIHDKKRHVAAEF
jgi:hypothetical protein